MRFQGLGQCRAHNPESFLPNLARQLKHRFRLGELALFLVNHCQVLQRVAQTGILHAAVFFPDIGASLERNFRFVV